MTTDESPEGTAVVINYYYDKIQTTNRIGYYTDKTKPVGYEYNVPPGIENGHLDNYLATAKVLGGSNAYVSGIQTGGTLTVQQGVNIIDILYTLPRDATVTIYYKDTNDREVAPPIIGATPSTMKLDETGTVIVGDGGPNPQPVQVMKEIPNCTFNRCDPLGGIDIQPGPNELTLIYNNSALQVFFNLNYAPVPNDAGHTQPSALPPKTVVYNTAYGDLPVPVRTGYTFEGWNTLSSGNGNEITPSAIVANSNDHTLYAKWMSNPAQGGGNGGGGNTGNIPVTGDDFDFELWFLMLILSMVVAIQLMTVELWVKSRQRG
jgi:uncharacterized repeat protein (TIGR02543 family)